MRPPTKCGYAYRIGNTQVLCDLDAGHLDDRLPHRSENHDEIWAEWDAKQRRDRQLEWLWMTPRRFHRASLETLDQPPKVRTQFAQWENGDLRTLILLGGPGTGKTFAALALTREDHVNGDLDVFFTSVSDMLATLRPDAGDMLASRSAGRFTDDRYANPLEFYQAVGILILDDLGAEKLSEWGDEMLYKIIDYRWSHQAALVVTSNLTVDQLKAAVGDRVYDRLRDDALAVRLSGPSRRGLRVVPDNVDRAVNL